MTAIDDYSGFGAGLTAPLAAAEPVTPSDGSDLSHVSRALWVGAGGDLRVTMADGATVTYPDLAAGWHPIRVSRVLATGTDAAGIVAAW